MLIRKLVIALILVMITSVLACSDTTEQKQVAADDETTLFKKATQAEIKGDFKGALDIYIKIAKDFPKSEHRDKALFMAGYLNFENLGEKEQAMKYFNELLDQYPESDLVDDTEFMIKAIESGKDVLTTFEETSDN